MGNVKTYLELSTAHLTQSTMEMLVADWAGLSNDHYLPVIASYEYGVIVWVTKDADLIKQAPADLAIVLFYAALLGVSSIRFDSDADEIEGVPLPVYDWESGEAI